MDKPTQIEESPEMPVSPPEPNLKGGLIRGGTQRFTRNAPGQDLRQRQSELIAGDGNINTVTSLNRLASQSQGNEQAILDMLPRRQSIDAQTGNPLLNDIERAAMVGSRFGIPLTWLVDQAPEDIPILADPVLAEVLLGNADVLSGAMASRTEYRRAIRLREAELIQERRSNQNMLLNIGILTPAVGNIGNISNALGLSATVPDEKTSAAIRAQAERDILRLPASMAEAQEQAGIITPSGGIGRALGNVFGTALGALGNALSFVAGSIATNINILSYGAIDAVGWMEGEFQRQQQAKIEQASDIIDLSENEQMQAAQRQFGDGFFVEMAATGQLQDFELMARGDPVMMRSLVDAYSELIWNADPQMQVQVTDQLTADQEAMVSALEETNFSIVNGGGAILSWYGYNVPLRLATYFTEFLQQDDLTDVFTSEGFQKIHQEALNSEFSPARSMGIDGTLMGIVVDLFGGIAFDPFTWIFGPRGRIGGVSTVDDAIRAAKSPVTRQYIRDLVRVARSPTRQEAATVALGEALDQFGLYDEFYAMSAGVEGISNTRDWLYGPNAELVREIPTNTILGLLDDADIAAARVKVAELTGSGVLNEAITLRLAGRTLRASTDDIARILYAQEQGIGAAPVIGLVDSTPVVPRMPLEQAQVLRDVADNPGAYAFHGTSSMSDEVVQSLLEGTDTFTGGGISAYERRARGFAVGDEGRILVFRRDSLNPRAQRILDSGQDVEKLFPTGAVTGPPVRPVFAFRASDSLDDLVAGADEVIAGVNPGTGRPLPAEARELDELATENFSISDLFDDEFLYPGESEVMPNLTALIEKVYRLGGGNLAPQRTVLSKVFANEFRDSLHSARGIGPWLTRYFTRQSTSNWLRTRGIGWQQEVRQVIIRLYEGRSPVFANLWLRRFREAIRIDNSELRSLQIELQRLNREIAVYADNSTGAFNGIPEVGELPSLSATVDDISLDSLNPAVVEAEKTLDNATIDTVEQGIEAELGIRNLDEDRIVTSALKEMGVIEGTGAQMGLSVEDLVAAGQRLTDEAERAVGILRARKALEAERARLSAQIATLAEKNQVAASKAAEVIIQEMWDDFKTRYIDTNPAWKDQLVDGKLPWEVLYGDNFSTTGRTAPEVVRSVDLDITAATGVSPNAVINDLIRSPVSSGVRVPLPPIDMIAASELGGAKWLRWRQLRLGESVKNVANLMNRMWMIDKVFRVSTSMVVSFDELLRGFGLQGAGTIIQWLEDKVMLAAAKAIAAKGAPASRSAMEVIDASRAIFKKPRWAKRMQTLQEYPAYFKQIESQFYENFGDAWDDILPGEAAYLPAADRWTRELLESDGFLAFMEGPEGFAAWWDSPQAGPIRTQSAFDWGSGHTRVATMEEAYKGYEFIMNELLLGKVRPARREAVREAFIDASRRIRTAGETVSIPQNILRELNMPIRGIRNQAPKVSKAGQISNAFFDNLFMQSTNYRRGFFAQNARTNEIERLTKLYQDQGIQIIPDYAIDRVLGTIGLRTNARFGLSEAIEQTLLERNVVTQGTITRMAEQRAMYEMEHMMYTWNMTSRAGRSALNRAVFPFGRPYYDMWSYYGRELLTRPALRGYINNANFANIGNMANKVVDYLPFNPKPAAMISRIAATDFNAEDQGLDFSPLLFLPKKGQSAMMSVLPGFGLLPMWAADYIISNMYDPFEQPVEYQRAVDAVAQWVPPFGYQQSGLAARALGGGITSTILKSIIDGYMVVARNNWHEPLALLGDIQSEIQTNRAIKDILANPEELADLMAANEQMLPGMFEGLIGEAFGRGAGANLVDMAARWMVPVNIDFDTTDDDVQQVWLDAGAQFPALQGPRYNANATEEQQGEQADAIRRLFFDLPDFERDLMLVQNPALAINMVSGWEWTEKAVNAFPEVAAVPYRSTGGTEGLARHQSYVRNDYVRPIQPTVLMYRIIGTIYQARISLAKSLYSDMANAVNDFRWQAVPEGAKNFLQSTVDAGQVDATDARDVWQRWSSLEEGLEETYGPMTLPENIQAWGTSWAGLDDENFSRRFRELTLDFFPESVVRSSQALGIEIESGMSGEQFLSQIHKEISNSVSDNALASWTRAEFDSYQNARSASYNAARNTLLEVAASPDFAEEFTSGIRDFVAYAERTSVLTGLNGDIDLERAENVREKYRQLMTANPEIFFSWDNVWEEGFARTYGPLDWKPPVPPTFDPEDRTNTYQPYIYDVVDGDTLVVSVDPTSPLLDLPGNRFDIQMEGTTPQLHQVRLLGVSAPEMSTDDGETWLKQLTDAILQARDEGLTISLVRDPRQAGRNTDFFGRELAWLFIGDKPYYYPETLSAMD